MSELSEEQAAEATAIAEMMLSPLVAVCQLHEVDVGIALLCLRLKIAEMAVNLGSLGVYEAHRTIEEETVNEEVLLANKGHFGEVH